MRETFCTQNASTLEFTRPPQNINITFYSNNTIQQLLILMFLEKTRRQNNERPLVTRRVIENEIYMSFNDVIEVR